MVLIMVIWFTGVNSAYQFLNDCMNDGLTMETTGAGGGNNSIGGTEQRPGIRVLDPTTNKTTTLLNNYFGFYFNGLDNPLRRLPRRHLVRRPRLRMEWQPDRHNPSTPRPNLPFSVLPTSQLWVIEDSLGQPNGIAISPDAENVYIWDTIAGSGTISPHYPNNPLYAL